MYGDIICVCFKGFVKKADKLSAKCGFVNVNIMIILSSVIIIIIIIIIIIVNIN